MTDNDLAQLALDSLIEESFVKPLYELVQDNEELDTLAGRAHCAAVTAMFLGDRARELLLENYEDKTETRVFALLAIAHKVLAEVLNDVLRTRWQIGSEASEPIVQAALRLAEPVEHFLNQQVERICSLADDVPREKHHDAFAEILAGCEKQLEQVRGAMNIVRELSA